MHIGHGRSQVGLACGSLSDACGAGKGDVGACRCCLQRMWLGGRDGFMWEVDTCKCK